MVVGMAAAVTQAEFDQVFKHYPSAKVHYRDRQGNITGLTVKIRNRDGWIELHMEVGAIRSGAIPHVFVLSPKGYSRAYIIRGYSQQLRRELPTICWGHGQGYGGHDEEWVALPADQRTLWSLIKRAEQLLSA